ncbi:MAG: FAD-binding oxidoreductase [Chloroflexota bacterium]|nr:FAD-binding oxidoreductase [Chloroflexota bacterium]
MTMPPTPSAEPRSYWHATAAPLVPGDPLPAEAEVVVVGGGLLGCWTAYWLARAGVAVTLIERTAISWGATGRNGGFVVTGTAAGYADMVKQVGREAARDLWRLTEEGQALTGRIVAEEGIACDYRTPGTLSLALSADSLDEMRRHLEAMRDDGLSGALLDRREVQALIGTPLGPEITGGSFFADGGLLHSARYLAGLASAARRRGAGLCRAGVTALVTEGERTRLETTAGPIRARRVIVAVNAWTDELVPGLAGLVEPVRGQILAYDPLPPVFTTGVGASVTPTGEYWQQTPEGTIVIGGCRADAPNGDVGVREMVPTPDVTGAIEAVLPRLFPALAGSRVARRWAGPMAFTADHLPIADAAPGLPGVWVTGGFSGHGMPYGPRLGQLLAEAAMTGTTPAPLAPLRLDRPTLTPLAGTT